MIYPLFLFLFVITSSAFTDFSGKINNITDGDTITVLTGAKEEKIIRLNGIDCPENGQAYGKKAKEFTKNLIARKIITVQSYDLDKHGRTLGDVMLEDGRNINQELVKHGWCWWYRKYAPGNLVLMKLEADAKEAKLGLWKDPDPIPPWEFRHGGNRDDAGSCAISRSFEFRLCYSRQ